MCANYPFNISLTNQKHILTLFVAFIQTIEKLNNTEK